MLSSVKKRCFHRRNPHTRRFPEIILGAASIAAAVRRLLRAPSARGLAAPDRPVRVRACADVARIVAVWLILTDGMHLAYDPY